MAAPYLSVIIPVYNETKRLSLTLIDVYRHLSRANFSYEILVVNDGSTDNTVDIARRFQALIKNLKFINNMKRYGKGKAVRQGVRFAKGRYRLFMDADNSTSIVEFGKMIPYLEQGYDVVIGSKRARGAQIPISQPLIKRLADVLGSLWERIWILSEGYDTRVGFKCFSKKAAEAIFSRSKINGWAFDAEILAIAKKLEFRIRQVPVYWMHHPRSRFSWKEYCRMLGDVVKIWRRVRS